MPANETPRGRPTLCTPELTALICKRLMHDESLNSICKDNNMPDKSTVIDWLAKAHAGNARYTDFANQYARVYDVRPEIMAEDMRDVETDLREGAIDAKTAQVLHNIKSWRMGKMKPKKYGDIKQIDVTGTLTTVHDVSDEIRAALTGRKIALPPGRVLIAAAYEGDEIPDAVLEDHNPDAPDDPD